MVHASVLDELAKDGRLIRRTAREPEGSGQWEVISSGPNEGYLHYDGNRYWALDVTNMLPLYQELYERVYVERLALWGAGASTGLLRTGGLILFWGCDEMMRTRIPSGIARERLAAADERWVDDMDQLWRQAAAALDEQVDKFWDALCDGTATANALCLVIDCKVRLTAIGMDSLIPPTRQIQEWLVPHLARQLLAEVLEGCYLPASGCVSYDALEAECWRLAAVYVERQEITNAARERFIRDGLFYLYNALNPDKKPYFFNVYPRQVALRYSRAAPDTDIIAARMSEIRHRSWRRRYHRQFARQRIEDLRTDATTCQRLLLLHRFIGSAKDFDEEKRRLNMKLWRSLFALADCLRISLARPDATLEALASALDHREGRLTIDPVFTATDPIP